MSDFAFIIKEKSRTLNIMNHATAHKSEQSVCFTNQNSVHSLHTVALGVYSQSREISVEQIRKESEDGLEVLFQEDVGGYDMKQGPGCVAFALFTSFHLNATSHWSEINSFAVLHHSLVCIGSQQAGHSCGSGCLQREAAMRNDATHTFACKSTHYTLL